jgi:hypothetical protein
MVREAESPIAKYTDIFDPQSLFIHNDGMPIKIWLSLQCPARSTFSAMIKVHLLFLFSSAYSRNMVADYVLLKMVQMLKSEIISNPSLPKARFPTNGSKTVLEME